MFHDYNSLLTGLTIPLSIIADILWREKQYETIFVIGVVPMFLSFFIIAMLTHYEDWDPLMDLIKLIWNRVRAFFCCRPQVTTSYVFDRQERESLINQETQSSQESAMT